MDSACAFCDRKNIEERLIYENDGFYVVATLGQITDGGYVLVIPKKHILCLGELSSDCLYYEVDKMWRIACLIINALNREYPQKNDSKISTNFTAFEHGIVGQSIKHAHLHILPRYLNFLSTLKRDFPNSKLEEEKYFGGLQSLYQKSPRPYLYYTNVFGHGTICWNPPAPAQYLRLMAAELLGRPERGNWRDTDPELDKRLGEETVRRLKPYFHESR